MIMLLFRGRQLVASFFVRDLGQDWRYGAEFFESHLIDHDPCSNYGKLRSLLKKIDILIFI